MSKRKEQSYLDFLLESFNSAPLHNTLGAEIRHFSRGMASSALQVEAIHLDQNGTVGEGILSLLGGMASKFAAATLVAERRKMVLLEQRLSVFASTKEGRLIAKAKIEHLRARVAQSRYQIQDEQGEIVATGGVIVYVLPPEQVNKWGAKEGASRSFDDHTILEDQFFQDDTDT